MAKRKEVLFGAKQYERDGVQLTVTRKGLEISGWFDSFVGLEGISVAWAELDAARERVNQKGSV